MYTKGVVHSLTANAFWGLAPIFWKQLTMVPSVQMLAHRIVWSLLLLVAILVATGQWPEFRATAFQRPALVTYSFSGVLMGVNLFLSVWSVVNGYIVEMSLGYFISPLVNVVLGVVFLRERLRVWQTISVGMAFAGVLVVAIAYGKFPWLALTLSSTFGLYGLVKKKAPLPALHGIAMELGIFFLPSVVYLVVEEFRHEAVFLHSDWHVAVLIVASAFITVVPSIFYSSAAQLIPLTLLGILQYIAPSLQFLVGVILYDEDFTMFKLVGFVCVWTGLVVFTVESVYMQRHTKPPSNSDNDNDMMTVLTTTHAAAGNITLDTSIQGHDHPSHISEEGDLYQPCATSKAAA
ncbi:hypothetical protein DYB37_010867 [Aphanomyces astaci]|uniref:EamA domain-containing protein n=1 Tax=Aphanomyces astaci TaxID=112090 RepID=A0A397C148_APHAT|nr:hypothetical protein DYB25_007165 [Aphanomyces astaci]RHY38048.1 hypothetical protein DYB38_004653 [Aphanomyces astaci]RHY53329.1 hypothetical protein DYB30_011948 [Aphanomyces astaci]RHY74227.1 hypothetical protein DYB34_005230 [Aphanomyces astaci]RHY92914.1 hypothetical protein DYB35_007294 [Aphanomyces astaci]